MRTALLLQLELTIDGIAEAAYLYRGEGYYQVPMIYEDDGRGCLTIKGRAGMLFETDSGEAYEISSEMVVSDEYHIAVHASASVRANEGRVVTGSEKAEVISRVIALCEKGQVRIRIF